MENIDKVVFVRNWNKGGVRTILEEVKLVDPEIRIFSKEELGIRSYFIMLSYLFNRRAQVNIHGWLYLRFVKMLKLMPFCNARIIYSLHSDPKKELTNYDLMNVLAKVADHITFVSEYHLESAVSLLGQSADLSSKASVIYYKINCISDRQCMGFELGSGTVGLITRLSQEKGIKTMCSMLPEGSTIWGDGPLLNSLTSEFKNLHFPGICHNVNEALGQIDIFVFTSSWGVWGISLLEAICLRKRFVYPRNENWRDLFPKESYCLSYDNNDSNSFYRALEAAKLMSVKDFNTIRTQLLSFPDRHHSDLYANL